MAFIAFALLVLPLETHFWANHHAKGIGQRCGVCAMNGLLTHLRAVQPRLQLKQARIKIYCRCMHFAWRAPSQTALQQRGLLLPDLPPEQISDA